jgi:membrane associated rhomboid family serine protease
MGLYDREYSREPEPGFHVTAPATATMQLVIITGGAYLAQYLFKDFTQLFELTPDWVYRPWECYRLLTYGFLHSLGERPGEPGVRHILFNMFGLWMFGRELERRLGRASFIAFYLTAIVFAGLVWTVTAHLMSDGLGPVIGASGGVVAVTLLFAMYYPNLDVLFMFAIPMKMWMVGVIIVLLDVQGAIQQSGTTAFTAHLGGAAYSLLYFKTRWNPAMWVVSRFSGVSLKRRPKLRVHEPDEEEADELSARVDAILEKIQREGQDSLTWNERRVLQKASRKAQEKRK